MSEPDAEALEALTQTLLGIANASFAARAPRSFDGDRWDVLAYLVNATADEVEGLFAELQQEREALQRTQQQLAQAEKLAALGRLAAGVAHQMNQPLTVITALVDLIGLRLEASAPEAREDLAMVAEATRQLSAIVESVLAFARGTPSVRAATPALSPVKSAYELFASELAELGFEYRIEPDDDLPPVLADAHALQQAFVNLLANARDAMADRLDDKPSIVIRVRMSADGEAVVYTVDDSGPGVSSEHVDQLFEPFFTTKGGASGTGLGLSVALGVIEQHGGTLRYEPRERGGARFIVRIPAMEAR